MASRACFQSKVVVLFFVSCKFEILGTRFDGSTGGGSEETRSIKVDGPSEEKLV